MRISSHEWFLPFLYRLKDGLQKNAENHLDLPHHVDSIVKNRIQSINFIKSSTLLF